MSSVDDADAESFSDELSPTDGYFEPWNHPNPGANENGSHDITSYRAVPAASSTSPSSPKIRHPRPQPPLLPTRHSSRPIFSEDAEPLRPYDQPPPAYSPPPSQPLVDGAASYNSISGPQLEEGRTPYQRGREPQSMCGISDETSPLFGRAQSRASHRFGCRRLLLLVAFLSLVAVTIAMGVKSSSKHRHEATPGGYEEKDKGGDSSGPAFNRPGASNGPYCKSASYRVGESSAQHALDSTNSLRVYQTFHDQGDSQGKYHIQTAGEIHIRKAPDNAKEAYMTTDFYISDRSLEQYITQEKEDGYLMVRSAQYGTVHTKFTNCISIEITIWLPDHTQITSFHIGATVLNIRVFDDVKAYVANSSDIGTISGCIIFPGTGHLSTVESRGRQLPKLPSFADLLPKLPEYFGDLTPKSSKPSGGSKSTESSPEPSPKTFSLRDTRIESLSGSISGTFQHYDGLYLSTKSGNIKAYIEPHAVIESDPKPAHLELHTVSGQIHAKYNVRSNDLPPRNYQTDVASKSGTITGDLILGSQCYVKSYSGSIDISALPFGVLDRDASTDFHTSSTSGGTDVVVLDPVTSTAARANGDEPYNLIARGVYTTLRSHHTSTSGHLHVRLPQSFEGKIEEKSISGGVRVVGDGVRIIRDDSRDWGAKKILAVRGEGDVEGYGYVKLDGISGDLDVEVGKVQ